MFKKSLLALSVAALSSTAMAGQIFSSVTENQATVTNGAPFTVTGAGSASEALGVIAGTAALVLSTAGNCEVAASDLNVTLGAGVFTNVPATGGDDVSNVAENGVYNAGASVTMTANDACSVVLADTASTATAKSPVEQTATISVGAAIVAGAGGFRQEDTITINFSGAKIKPAVVPTLVTAAGVATDHFELLDITDSQVRFTVKTQSNGDVPAFAILNLAGVSLDTTGVTTGSKVSIDTFATNTSGTQYDVTAAKAIHELVPQYSMDVDRKFNGIINVSDDRQSLAAEDGTAGPTINDIDQDTLQVEIDLDATTNPVTVADVTFTLTGDFSWLPEAANASDDGKAATAAEITTYLNAADIFKKDTGGFGDADSYALDSTNTKLTISNDDAAPQGVYDIRLEVPGKGTDNPILMEQSFTVAAEVTNGLTGTSLKSLTASTAVDAGEWVLNGSVITIPYMPFDDNTAVILRHTNTGVQTGDIAVRYMVEGSAGNTASTKWSDSFVVGESTRGVQNIRDIVINKIKEELGMDAGKVAIEITTNVPEADVTVYAAYRVKDENDRGFVGTFGKHGSAQ